MKRKLTPDELNSLEGMGYNTSSYKGELIEFPDPVSDSTATGAAVRGLASEAIPATAGAASFAGGAAASAPLALAATPVLGPFAAGIPIIAGLGSSILGSTIARKVQDAIIPQTWTDTLAQDAAEHPIASRAGQLGAMALTMRPSVGVTKEALRGVAQLPTSVGAFRALTPESRAALANVGLGAGISGATEVGRELVTGEDLSPRKILGETAIGAAFNKPTALGRTVMRIPAEAPVRPVLSERAMRSSLAQIPAEKPAEPVVKIPEPVVQKMAEQEKVITELKAEQAKTDEVVKAVAEDIVNKETAAPKNTLTPEEQAELEGMTLNQPSTSAKSSLQEEVVGGINKLGKTVETVTPSAKKIVGEHLTQKNIGTVENPELAAAGEMTPTSPKREIVVNPKKEDVFTRPHEGLHWMRTEIETEAGAGDARSKRLLENLDKAQEQARAEFNAQRATQGLPPVDAHEFSVNEQGFEFMKQQLNLKKESEWRKWWNDTKALWNVRFGKNPSVEELRRAMNFRFVHEQGLGKVGKEGPLGKVGEKALPVAGANTTRKQEEKIPEGYRKVRVEPKAGEPYEALFNDKFYPGTGKLYGQEQDLASIAKFTPDGKVTHTNTRPGDKIVELGDQTRQQDQTSRDERSFMTSSERVLKTVKGAQNGKQLTNTLRNKIPPAEWDILQKAGIEKEFEGRIVKPEEISKWVQENGPKAEVHSYGMEGKVSEAKKEYDKMTHEWLEAMPMQRRMEYLEATENPQNLLAHGEVKTDVLKKYGWSDEQIQKGIQYEKARQRLAAEPAVIDNAPRATQYYSTVSALPANEPMPDWTATKSGKNVQRVDVVIPQKESVKMLGTHDAYTGEEHKATSMQPDLWQPDNLHENLPNTLGWAMIQYKTGPNGEKIAVIAEAQSRWGQTQREKVKEIERRKLAGNDQATQDYIINPTIESAKATDHPLLRDYNRLILKAAIEQARKEGATHIMVSDAETAMMTERHDLHNSITSRVEAKTKEEAIQKAKTEHPEAETVSNAYQDYSGRWIVDMQGRPTQEPGMRLNYDTILPKIAEELTGSKGERVSLGEHKNAYTKDAGYNQTEEVPFPPQGESYKRSNLIFRNPDGTPKTDISGHLYPLERAKGVEEPFSYFEKRSQGEEQTAKDIPAVYDTDTSPKSFGIGNFRPMTATFDKVERVSTKHAQAGRNYEARRDQYTGLGNTALKDLSEFSPDDVNRVMAEHRRAYREGGEPDLSGTNDQAISQILRDYYGKIADVRRELGVRINDRRPGKNEYYVPDMMSAETADLFINHPTSPEALYAKNKWAEYVQKETEGKMPLEKIKKDISEYIAALGGKHNYYGTLEFGAIRRASGYGLPEELRDLNAINTLARYSRRAAADLAFFQEIQNKPEIAGPLKIKNQEGSLWPGYSETPLTESKEIKDMMNWITGSITGRVSSVTPKVNAAVRLVNNSLLGTATGLRDLVSVPMNALPYIHQFSDLGAAWKGMMTVRENSRDALRTAAVQPSIDRVQFDDILNQPDRFVSVVGKAADLMRKYQGREALENLSREITFSVGKELAKNNILGANAGNQKSVQWLKKFGDLVEGDVTKLEGDALENALNQIAKNFVDRNQGTYGGRGLPLGVIDSQFAPFLSLQKWSIEKSNVIYKDVVRPFITGENRLPLLTYTLGSFLTGAAIQELNKVLSGRKSQDPDIKEALTKGDAASIVQELATIMQLGSYGGIVSDSMKTLADTAIRGKTPRNIVSFPTATAAVKTEEAIVDATEAIRQGENPWDVIKNLSLDLMVNNVQSARMIANRTWKSEDVERSDKFRDVRVFNELEGKPAKDITRTNPYLGIKEKKFKRTQNLGEATKLGGELVKEAVTESKGNPEELGQKLRSLKGNSYQTMPSPESQPVEFRKFYDFLVETQGKEAANQRVVDYLTQSELNRAKASLIP